MSIICTKYRIYPTKSQTRDLEQTLTTCRELYNSLVNTKKHDYEVSGKSPSLYQMHDLIVEYKKNFPELTKIHSQVLQNVAVRVELAFQSFFRRVKAGETPGFPRTKSESYDSFTYPQTGFSVGDDSIKISKSVLSKQKSIENCKVRLKPVPFAETLINGMPVFLVKPNLNPCLKPMRKSVLM